jgi:hypothetical protein
MMCHHLFCEIKEEKGGFDAQAFGEELANANTKPAYCQL